MRITRTVLGLVAGGAVVAVGLSLPTDAAEARARRKGRSRGALRVLSVNLEGSSNVAQNEVLEIRMSGQPSRQSVNPAVFQIRAQNDLGTGFAKQVPGELQIFGNVVRFYPRLPTHRRDLTDPEGGFYSFGHERDNAAGNAGFQPSTGIELRILGYPHVAAVRAAKGNKRLNRTYTARFTTAGESPKTKAFSIASYVDNPPPGFQFSNPSDKVAAAADQYARRGGAADVPSAVSVTLFGNRVPLSPATIRTGDNVSLTLLERNGDTSVRKAIQGTPFVEQNFETMRLAFQPRFPLPDRGIYAFRVSKDVKDLTETYSFANNAERLRLREVYEFLSAARAFQPGVPAESLDDPPLELIFDWPTGTAARGVLKRNLLELGDGNPEEVDPRVMVLFSTRDEPVSDGKIILEFTQEENVYDETISTANWDLPPYENAVAAIHTIAAGDASDGNFLPQTNQDISIDSFPNRTINWRKVFIPNGVEVRIRGSRPAIVKALEFTLEGKLSVDGEVGENANSGAYASSYGGQASLDGGAGGPGGGRGADSGDLTSDFALGKQNNSGIVGNDSAGRLALPPEGGRGGEGGSTAGAAQAATIYKMGGGGGGGGSRLAGTAGAMSSHTTYATSWGDGAGGPGGAGSNNPELNPLVGGAGGGAGGHGLSPQYNWSKTGAAGGGGGGAILVQTSTTLEILGNGVISARGGRGGNGSGNTGTISCGPAGGGGAGSILLRSSQNFNITNGAQAFDLRGGSGGTQSGTYSAPNGGTGGAGYLRIESPSGGAAVPGGTQGFFDPVGGGVPSVAYTKFIDVGVDGARFLNFTTADLVLTPGADDALLIEIQYAIEDTDNFGSAKTSSIDPATQNSSNPAEASSWLPIIVMDNTPTAGGAFPTLQGYNRSSDGNQKVFETAVAANGKLYKFVRFRFTFQLDNSQTVRDPLPNVSRLVMNFQFND